MRSASRRTSSVSAHGSSPIRKSRFRNEAPCVTIDAASVSLLKRGLPANTLLSGLPGSIYLVDTFPVGGKGITPFHLRRHGAHLYTAWK